MKLDKSSYEWASLKRCLKVRGYRLRSDKLLYNSGGKSFDGVATRTLVY